MCGISGFIKLNGDRAELREITQLTSCLAHRGPDGDGFLLHENAAIGHRRLALIDVTGGQQPISNEDDTISITYNGEIYNYLELHKILEAKGHKFKTKSDTEVVIHAYEEWGEDCLLKFRGMFAFVLLDKNKNEFFIARDHMGIKPIVYYHDSNYFVFASEISAIKNFDTNLNLELNLNALDQYLWLQYIPAPNTIYKNINKLKPGHYIKASFNGRIGDQKQYWDLSFNPNFKKTEDEWLEELDFTLKDSVKAHLMSEVPFGAFLSGGIDSSTIVSYMSEILKDPVKTFTIGFPEKEYNEIEYAEAVAKAFKTEHYSNVITSNALDILPDLVKHYGEPFGDSSALPTYYVSKFAREKVTMVLSGDGGDELFAGYDTYKGWLEYLSVAKVKGAKYLDKIGIPKPLLYKYTAEIGAWLRYVNYLSPETRQKLWRNEFKEQITFKLDDYEKHFEKAKSYSSVNRVQYMDIKTYMPYDILNKVDIASMMSSLEVRTPIIDTRVAEFAATIPTKYNVTKSQKGYNGKVLLKKLLERKLGSQFVNRPKKGFSIPIEKWFEKNGSWDLIVNERLLSKNAKINNFFDPNAVQEIVKSNNKNQVWLLIFLEEWLQQNKI